MTAKKQTLAENNMPETFAERMSALESIVQSMETGNLPLEQALAAYAQGTQLLQVCQADLQQAEQTVLMLNQQQQLVPLNPEE